MIEWDDKYSVGISIIDDEHKQLIGIINKAIAARQHSNNSEEIIEILNEMNKYALTHFADEEAYMVQFDYPDYEQHRKEHQGFSIETMAFLDIATKGGGQITGTSLSAAIRKAMLECTDSQGKLNISELYDLTCKLERISL